MNPRTTPEAFRDAVYDIVRQIPYGKVYTYGRVADLAGFVNYSRHVGNVLKHASGYELPWHRVVNSEGRIAPGHPEQKKLLKEEGVLFNSNGKVDMKRCLWRPEDYNM
jgi:methylated-DNA-protein-cysteine methyltransferase-like protein